MSIYSASNRSIENIDPLKQAAQVPLPPSYTPRDESTPEMRRTPSVEQHNEKARGPVTGKPTIGERFHKLSSKAGWPLNKAANVIGAEGWWPTSMDKECNKAARILHSFTQLDTSTPPKTSGPMHPTGLTKKSMVKIPPAVLRNCAGLAIFNVLRAGACHSSLAGGSGVVVARRDDGTWSPPSAFIVTTIGAGFMFGLDVYDCVCVLNTQEQVNAFTNPRVSLGAEGSITMGPVGTGGHVESAVSKTAKPMWSYMKSRGLWAGVQIDGTIILSRADANGLFYNERGISARRILREDVAWPMGAKPLFEVLRALEGHADFDRAVVQEVGRMPPPSDIVSERRASASTVSEREHAAEETKPYTDEPHNEEPPKYKDDEEEYDMVDEKTRLAKSGY